MIWTLCNRPYLAISFILKQVTHRNDRESSPGEFGTSASFVNIKFLKRKVLWFILGQQTCVICIIEILYGLLEVKTVKYDAIFSKTDKKWDTFKSIQENMV